MEMQEYGDASSCIVLIQMADDHDLAGIEREMAAIRENTKADFLLRVFRVKRWNEDLSPWNAPAVFGHEDFGAGAEDTLKEILKTCEDRSRTYIIGGYSLAGLFALWSVYQTDVFEGAAAASPSVWFPGFTDYMKNHEIRTERVYLSLGDKEEKTRNPVMAAVADRIQEAEGLIRCQNRRCTLEWNPGNHFKEPELRMAKGFSWILRQLLQS
ncbi:MAG: esterase [[Clostridium] aminophilum]|uniref:esterase n=1 Tax=[Clostridium] aminophilum TaxID=1526 RepID=UPI0026EBECB6|nr:esterase [[Clostridium] aminophilum]MDD6195292.1 esterase [[Clostridium] aminophilum]